VKRGGDDEASPSGGFGRVLYRVIKRARTVAWTRIAAARRALARAWAIYRRRTERAHPYDSIAFGFLAAALGVALLIRVTAGLFRPDLSPAPFPYPPEEVREAEAARDVRFDPDRSPVITREVDYAGGPGANWRPKGEAPVLAELVREGKLPPVTERVPEEPLVLEGVEGIGKYGGTWLRAATSPNDVGIITYRMSYTSLMGWAPLGYPITPRVAKGIESSADMREFVVTLRKGMKWSDGEPLAADDIMYWWECEVTDESVSGRPPPWMLVAGKPGKVEKIDELRVKFSFDAPYGLFIECMATSRGNSPVNSPEHYLRPYHPTLGDEELCRKAMEHWRLPSRRSLYSYVRHYRNPEHPRLWPWVYRTYKSNPPQVFVRNPYFYAVDTRGNQLPYVDRVQFDVQDGKMLALSASNGKLTMQTRHLRYEDYTELVSRRAESGTRVLQWYPGSRSVYAINPNLNRRVDPARPDTKWKAKLLADRRFRQALSLAIDRAAIIKAEYNGQVEPAQVAPGPESPFHHEGVMKAFTELDPERANRMLDELELTQRDYEGYRRFPDGTRMVFYLDTCPFTGQGPAQLVAEDWGRVGVRVVPRERSRSLFYNEKNAAEFDFNVWTGESDYMPLMLPRYFVAHHTESFYAVGWGRWFMRGGFYGSEDSKKRHCIPVPTDHPMYQAMVYYEQALQARTLDEQVRAFNKALDICAENTWTINISVAPPQLVVVKKDFRNVPGNALYGVIFCTPGPAGIETYYFEDPADSPGAVRETKQAIVEATPRPGATSGPDKRSTAGRVLGFVIKLLLAGVFVGGIGLVAAKHPYVARRLAVMVPTLLVISLIVFVIIQLPPGDYLTTRIMQLRESGDEAAVREMEDLRALFRFEDPAWKRYLRWMGLKWFVTFDGKDAGLLQGDLGRSMESTQQVNDIVGDRILLTILISLGTILFTWAVAVPIGIYSAVKQHSWGDYLLTFVGFIGMCVPAFLLALILMAISGVSGLFSAEYAAQPEWTWGKFVDLLKHIWIPVIVLGVGGTAGMIRVMRANLLDELRKPYVLTAMAKGVRPMKLLFKYPVRLALNPFVSGIGGLFPMLVSGGAIVAMVLSLPTVGPLMLASLFSEDMYLAGSMLMVLSLLGIFGTLVSDLLLLWLDPRIRFKGGTR
jgi:ABC-type dipeptide/oligopeptide/nickel transport system permease component/ABC-type transport system substrate-binding protein